MTEIDLRAARHDDYEDVVSFTEDTWADRDREDYLPRLYHDWIEGEDRRTVVAEVDGELAGIAQSVLLSDWEAWNQGLRVHPEHRGEGVSAAITEALFDWARRRGATAARIMVFSWNAAGLGQARATGYDPVTEFRWVRPEPDPGAERGAAIGADPDAAWRFWTESAAREALAGLAIDAGESWALSRLTRADLRAAADDDRLLVVQDGGTRGFAHRVREYEREGDSGETTRWAEYGVGAWADAESGAALLAAISRDAADRGADRTRVAIPETAAAVSDAGRARAEIADEPDFVLGADLTR